VRPSAGGRTALRIIEPVARALGEIRTDLPHPVLLVSETGRERHAIGAQQRPLVLLVAEP